MRLNRITPLKHALDKNKTGALIPGFVPVILAKQKVYIDEVKTEDVGPVAIYRGQRDIRAVYLQDNKVGKAGEDPKRIAEVVKSLEK